MPHHLVLCVDAIVLHVTETDTGTLTARFAFLSKEGSGESFSVRKNVAVYRKSDDEVGVHLLCGAVVADAWLGLMQPFVLLWHETDERYVICRIDVTRGRFVKVKSFALPFSQEGKHSIEQGPWIVDGPTVCFLRENSAVYAVTRTGEAWETISVPLPAQSPGFLRAAWCGALEAGPERWSSPILVLQGSQDDTTPVWLRIPLTPLDPSVTAGVEEVVADSEEDDEVLPEGNPREFAPIGDWSQFMMEDMPFKPLCRITPLPPCGSNEPFSVLVSTEGGQLELWRGEERVASRDVGSGASEAKCVPMAMGFVILVPSEGSLSLYAAEDLRLIRTFVGFASFLWDDFMRNGANQLLLLPSQSMEVEGYPQSGFLSALLRRCVLADADGPLCKKGHESHVEVNEIANSLLRRLHMGQKEVAETEAALEEKRSLLVHARTVLRNLTENSSRRTPWKGASRLVSLIGEDVMAEDSNDDMTTSPGGRGMLPVGEHGTLRVCKGGWWYTNKADTATEGDPSVVTVSPTISGEEWLITATIRGGSGPTSHHVSVYPIIGGDDAMACISTSVHRLGPQETAHVTIVLPAPVMKKDPLAISLFLRWSTCPLSAPGGERRVIFAGTLLLRGEDALHLRVADHQVDRCPPSVACQIHCLLIAPKSNLLSLPGWMEERMEMRRTLTETGNSVIPASSSQIELNSVHVFGRCLRALVSCQPRAAEVQISARNEADMSLALQCFVCCLPDDVTVLPSAASSDNLSRIGRCLEAFDKEIQSATEWIDHNTKVMRQETSMLFCATDLRLQAKTDILMAALATTYCPTCKTVLAPFPGF